MGTDYGRSRVFLSLALGPSGLDLEGDASLHLLMNADGSTLIATEHARYTPFSSRFPANRNALVSTIQHAHGSTSYREWI